MPLRPGWEAGVQRAGIRCDVAFLWHSRLCPTRRECVFLLPLLQVIMACLLPDWVLGASQPPNRPCTRNYLEETMTRMELAHSQQVPRQAFLLFQRPKRSGLSYGGNWGWGLRARSQAAAVNQGGCVIPSFTSLASPRRPAKKVMCHHTRHALPHSFIITTTVQGGRRGPRRAQPGHDDQRQQHARRINLFFTVAHVCHRDDDHSKQARLSRA